MLEKLFIAACTLIVLIIIGVWIASIKNEDKHVYPEPTAEDLRQADIEYLATLKEQLANDPSEILKQQIADLEKKLGL